MYCKVIVFAEDAYGPEGAYRLGYYGGRWELTYWKGPVGPELSEARFFDGRILAAEPSEPTHHGDVVSPLSVPNGIRDLGEERAHGHFDLMEQSRKAAGQ